MVKYSYDEFSHDVKVLQKALKDFEPDYFLVIARGAMTLAHCLSHAMNVRSMGFVRARSYEGKEQKGLELSPLPDLGGAKKIIVLDDIVDSGKTMQAIMQEAKQSYPHKTIKTASLFYKESASVEPDYYVRTSHDWIEFFWESYATNGS